MTEQTLVLRDALMNGLRNDYRQRRNERTLTVLRNMRPTEHGLSPMPVITTPLADAVSGNWPFPQLFAGKKNTYAATANKLYLVDDSAWTAAEVAVTGSIATEVTPWHFVDFWDTWCFLNEATLIVNTNSGAMLGGANTPVAYSNPIYKTGCAFRGRAVFGGVDPAQVMNSNYTSFISDWTQTATSGLTVNTAIASNFIIWTEVGGGDLIWPLTFSQQISGLGNSEYDGERPKLFDMMLSLGAGFIPMPFKCSVKAVHPLETAVIVYTDGGIAALVPGAVLRDYSTLGLRPIINVGVSSRGCVGVGDDRHVFVDDGGYLWTIDANLKIERLGFLEYFDQMLGNEIMITYMPEEREYFISDGYVAYVLTPQGKLFQVNQLITSGMHIAGGFVGCSVAESDDDQEVFDFTTELLDFGMRGFKQIGYVEVCGQDITNVSVSVYYRNAGGAAWAQTQPRLCREDGIVYVGITAEDLKLRVRGTAGSLAKIDAINVHWVSPDARFRRGLSPNAD